MSIFISNNKILTILLDKIHQLKEFQSNGVPKKILDHSHQIFNILTLGREYLYYAQIFKMAPASKYITMAFSINILKSTSILINATLQKINSVIHKTQISSFQILLLWYTPIMKKQIFQSTIGNQLPKDNTSKHRYFQPL